MKITTLVEKETDVKTLKIHLTVRDGFNGKLLTAEWEKVCEREDTYVPDFVPWSYGDTVELDIDIETGKITNRPKINSEYLKEIISSAQWEIEK